MRLFIDTEFNGFGGEFLSIGLVSEDGREFYGALKPSGNEGINHWVAENVLPFLGVPHLSKADLQDDLQQFLGQFDELVITSDWPEDHKHFCDLLIVGFGRMMKTPRLVTMEVDRRLHSGNSKMPHNALADAHAIRQEWLTLNGSVT